MRCWSNPGEAGLGCHRVLVTGCTFRTGGANAVQAKGGSSDLTVLRCQFEECGERGRAQLDVDLIGPDIDALDQGGEDDALACSGQLGPTLPELGGACDEPTLRRQIGKLCRLVDIAGIEKPLTDSADHELFDLRGRDTQSG